MSPPTYSDLGKGARDVFSKGYQFGTIKINASTTTSTGVNVSTGGDHCLETGKVNGNLETKYKCSDYGLTITEKWNTENILKTDISVEELAKGLKLVAATSFSPVTGKKKGNLTATYKADAIALNLDSNLVTCPVLNGAAVAGYQNFLFGYQMQYDTSKYKMTKNNFAVGFTSKDFTVHTFANDGSDFGGSLHHKLGKGLEGAVNLGWSINSNTTNFGLGCKYALDKASSVRAKVDSSAKVGLGYQTKMRDGVTLTLSALVDGKNLNSGGHKVGLGLEFEA